MAHHSDSNQHQDHGPHTLRVCEGTVVGVHGDDVFVELGPRSQGVISVRRFPEPPEPGQTYDFTLRGQEEGLWVLELQESRTLDSWECMERGLLVHARVIRCNPGGLELKIGRLHAFMPRSQTGLPRERSPAELVGKNLTCEVIEVDPERQRVTLSRKLVQQRERESERERLVGSLRPGRVMQGRVRRIEPYGVFVRLGTGMEGMVHVSNLSYERVAHPEEVVHKGETIEVVVLAVRQSGKRISLGLKQMSPSPWEALAADDLVDRIVEGTVTRVADYGLFVAVRPGVEGLAHRSECGLAPDRLPRERFAPGQPLSVRVLDLDVERERLSLSLLYRDGSGIDAEEAANARELAGSDASADGGGLGTNLGRLLQGALEPPPAGPDPGPRPGNRTGPVPPADLP